MLYAWSKVQVPSGSGLSTHVPLLSHVPGKFLGEAVTTRMVQLLKHSPAARALIGEVFSGSQEYRGLKQRLWDQVGVTILEFARSFLTPRRMIVTPRQVRREPLP